MVLRAAAVFMTVLLTFLIAGCEQRFTDNEQIRPEEKIVIRFSHVVPQNTPKGLAAKRFARLVNERTGGKVEVQVFPNSTLYKDGEEFEALLSNNVQLIAPVTSKLGKMFPRWQLFDLPYAFKTREEVYRVVEGDVWRKLCEDLERKNIKALAFWDNGFKQLTNNERELIYPEDCRGLSFRVMINSQVLEDQFRTLGAVPVPMPFSEVYRGLEKDYVDGQENTISNIYAKKFYRVQPYLTVSNHGYMGYVVLTNSQFWDSLSPNIRKVLENTMAEVTAWERQKAAELNMRNFEQLIAQKDIKIHVQTAREKKEWIEKLRPIYSKYERVIGTDLMRAVINLQDSNNRPL